MMFDSEKKWRIYSEVEAISATHVKVDGTVLLQVSSTSYLSMNWNKQFVEAVRSFFREVSNDKISSLSSNYLGGYHSSKVNFENYIAETLNFDKALAFSSGWNANYAICEYLATTHDKIISHISNHNSIIESLKRFRDKVVITDVQASDFENVIAETPGRIAIIYPTIEGLTGVGCVPAVTHLQEMRITFVSDESHSFGMIGSDGTSCYGGFVPNIRIVGFSKALGGVGGIVCGNSNVIDWLQQNASTWIFSTPLPPYIWEVNKIAMRCAKSMNTQRKQINISTDLLKANLSKLDIAYSGNTHIIGILLSEKIDLISFERSLALSGIYIRISQFPSLPIGVICCRIALNAHHTQEQIIHLAETLSKVIK